MILTRKFLLVLSAVVISFLIVKPADGIPAFARKYQISCQVCHSPFPYLKPFGENFASNGYRMTEYEAPRYFIQTGDEKLSLLRELPIAVRIDGIASYNTENSKSIDFGAPSGVKLLSGGELSDRLSYYFYFFMSEGGNIVGIEDAFITYNNLFGTGINFSVGQFQACDPFYKRELRLTLEDIAILNAVPGTSSVSLKYERGIMLNYEIPKIHTGIVAEVLNGNGINGAGEEFLFDKDKYKNLLVYVTQPIGNNLSMGLLGYTGKEIVSGAPLELPCKTKMVGPVVNLNFNQKLIVNAQYIFRTDSRIYDSELEDWSYDADTQGGYIEVIFAPKGDMSNWYLTGLLNQVESDYNILDYKSASIQYGYLLRRNLRLLSEFTWLDGEEKYCKISAGFVAGF
ncbi:MAG: hypothetical protein KA114_02155 [Bacteroidales bacterium]|nr:hypothetical protein [Bacteroidales bacterium]